MKKNTNQHVQCATFEPNKTINPVGIIDSFNISNKSLISIIIEDENFKIEPVKKGKEANEKRWIQEFGMPLYHQTKTGRWAPFEAYIVHCIRGVTLPIKVFKHARGITEILEFAGMHKYTDEAEQRKLTLSDIWDKIQYCQISRIDVAIDLVNQQQIDEVGKALKHVGRHPEIYKNTTYYKTAKQAKKRSVVNILQYDKGTKEKWKETKEITRFEFQFRSEFFGKMQVKDFAKAVKKIENRILRDTAIKIKILPISSKLIPKPHLNDNKSNFFFRKIIEMANSTRIFIKKEIDKIMSTLNQVLNLLTQIQTDLKVIIIELKPKRNKSSIQPMFLPTKDMAMYLSVSISFLDKNMGKIFIKDTHYNRPIDARLLRWDVMQMHKWMKGGDRDETDKQLLSKLLD